MIYSMSKGLINVNTALKSVEKNIIQIMTFLLAIAIVLTYYSYSVLRTDIVFYHFFYIPIIIAAKYWKRKGFVVAVFLVALMTFGHIFLLERMLSFDDYFRVSMLIAIALLVDVLYEKIEVIQDSFIHSEERFSKVFQANPIPIIIRKLTGPIIDVNDSCLHLLGYHREEIIGRSAIELGILVNPDDSLRIAKALDERQSIRYMELSIRIKSGEIRQVISSFETIELDSEPCVLVMFYDITERKKAEELEHENLRLEHVNKAKSELLAIMSHELRSPLNSIIGYSSLLEKKAQANLDEDFVLYVHKILTNSKDLLNLINNFLDLAKAEMGKLEMVIEEISVQDIINEIFNTVNEDAINHNIILKKKFDPALDFIKVDKQKFKQILFNLLNNAIKFSKDVGGIVTISAVREDDIAKFSVSDTGIGIREDDIPKLFKKFEQLDQGLSRKYEGTGLGLAIAKQLVEMHDGKITVESKYQEGSTFTVFLPIVTKND